MKIIIVIKDNRQRYLHVHVYAFDAIFISMFYGMKKNIQEVKTGSVNAFEVVHYPSQYNEIIVY